MTNDFASGNYRFIPAVFQYSSGAMALPGYEIERVRFNKWLPLAEGFAHVAKYIQAAGRPLTSFCACELRSPGQFTDHGFIDFNRHYVQQLGAWGIFRSKLNYLSSYKGLTFFTKCDEEVVLPPGTELVRAGKI